VWKNLQQIPKDSAPEVDGQQVTEAKESFGAWIEPMLQSCTVRGIVRRRSGVSISRSLASMRNAVWVFLVSVTGAPA